MNVISIIALLLAVALCGGCKGGKRPAAAEDTAVDPTEPKQAQPKLPTMKLYLGAQEMVVELARTAMEQRTGMMFRTNMQ
jgi:hypothetical protein